jgi:hypothetical protein
MVHGAWCMVRVLSSRVDPIPNPNPNPNPCQARRLHTNHHYSDVPLLTTFGGYILQLVYYTNNNFNHDTRYQELF